MKQFSYQAVNQTGTPSSGIIESFGEKQAAHALQERGLMVVSLTEKQSFDWRTLGLSSLKKVVDSRELATFTRLLATMLSTGLPLTDALSNLAIQAENKNFQEVIRSIQADVQSGMSLSVAMSRHAIFSELYISLVQAGEATGKVGETLERLAANLEADLDFKAKVSGALVYPIIIVTAMTAIAIFMMTTIIPKIAAVYKEFGADLPLPTKILIALSTGLFKYFPLVILSFLLALFVYQTLRKNPVSDNLLNNLRFRLPIFGKLNGDVALANLSRTLGTLLSSGIAIVDALRIVAATMANDHFRSGLFDVSRAVEKGLPFSTSLRRNVQFPLMMAQLTAIGEETGTLDQSLTRLAKFYEDSAERKIKVLTTAIEPMMLLLMGVMVGGLAIAVLLPMFNLVNVVR